MRAFQARARHKLPGLLVTLFLTLARQGHRRTSDSKTKDT